MVMNKLYSTIKAKLEEDGVLREVLCLLYSKMVAMMGDKNEPNYLLQKSHSLFRKEGDARITLLHQLIMEYLHWHGFYYTAEMFSMESSCENVPQIPESLDCILGKFDYKDLPVLLELIATMSENKTGSHCTK